MLFPTTNTSSFSAAKQDTRGAGPKKIEPMFLRIEGKRVELLHAYRDGRCKVCQRRLWTFRSSQELEQACWEEIRDAVEGRWPDLRGDWERVAQQASRLSAPPRKSGQTDKLRQAARRLRLWLDREPELAGEARVELAALQAALQRLELPQQPMVEIEELLQDGEWELAERRLEEIRATRDGDAYLPGLKRLARLLRDQGRAEEAAAVLSDLVRREPTAENQEELGMALFQAGRVQEAWEQFRKPLLRSPFRHYNEAAALLAAGRRENALQACLRGMARDRRVTDWLLKPKGRRGAAYWERFGALWEESARSFLRAVASDRVVRVTLSYVLPKKLPSVRVLLPRPMLTNLLRRVQTRQEEDLAERAKSGGPCN